MRTVVFLVFTSARPHTSPLLLRRQETRIYEQKCKLRPAATHANVTPLMLRPDVYKVIVHFSWNTLKVKGTGLFFFTISENH